MNITHDDIVLTYRRVYNIFFLLILFIIDFCLYFVYALNTHNCLANEKKLQSMRFFSSYSFFLKLQIHNLINHLPDDRDPNSSVCRQQTF